VKPARTFGPAHGDQQGGGVGIGAFYRHVVALAPGTANILPPTLQPSCHRQ
jgi:hypothetical protein